MWLNVQNKSVFGAVECLVSITAATQCDVSVMMSRTVARIHLRMPFDARECSCLIAELINGENKWIKMN